MVEIKRREIKPIPYNQLGKAGYNRKLSRARINEIKSDFHEDMVRDCIVSFRDGKYFVVDGQHTSQAIYELSGRDPEVMISCDIRDGLTYTQEADLYCRLNTGSKPLTLIQRIRGLIDAKDVVAIEFQETIESFGYSLGGNNNRLHSIDFAWKIFNSKNGKEKLSQILNVTSECWLGNPKGVNRKILGGLEVFFRVHANECSIETLITNLAKITPQQLIEDADTFYHTHDSHRYKHPYCTYREILRRYNENTDNKLVAQEL